MFDPAKFALFVVASAVLIVTPGPAVLYIVARSISQGRTAGLVTAAGVGVGNLCHAVAAAVGVSALLASSAVAFSALKYAGAAYLLFMGLRKILGKSSGVDVAALRPEPRGATFKQGIMVGLLNPKTVLFFLAFLPQFASPAAGPVWSQLLLFGVTFVLMAIVGDSGYALLSGTFATWIKQRKAFLRNEKYFSGAVYCGLGVLTAFSGSGKV